MTEAEIREKKTSEKEAEREPVLRYKCSPGRVSLMKKVSAVPVVLMTAAFVITGTYPCQSMGDIAVLISWALYLVPLLISWFGLMNLLRLGGEMTPKQQKKGPARMLQGAVFGALLSAVSVFCCIYFLVTGEYESIAAEIGMVVRVLAEFFGAFCLAALTHYHMSQLEE